MGLDAMILVFWTLSFKPTFSLSSFTIIKRLFSSSSISAIGWCHLRIWGYWYFFWKPWFQFVLHVACIWHDIFCIEDKQAGWHFTALIYSFPNLESACCSMSVSNCCFLTCIQISQETCQVVWYFHLLHNFPQFVLIHTVKVFGIVNKPEIDVFLWNSLDFLMIQRMLAV